MVYAFKEVKRMKTLPSYAKALLLHGASDTGSFTEGSFLVEESLHSEHFDECFEFCKWIDEHIGGAGPVNIDWLFQSFSDPSNNELANKAKELSDKIRRIKALVKG